MCVADVVLMNTLPSSFNDDNRKCFRDFVMNVQDRLLIVLDGFDECSMTCLESPIRIGAQTKLKNIITNKFNALSKECVLITSRPHKVHELENYNIGLVIRIQGFSVKQAKMCVKIFLSSRSSS